MMPVPHGSTMEREVAAETLAAAMSPLSVRAIQQRLERILIDDRELLISLQCQLEQIRRELRLLNNDRIVRALDGQDRPLRH
jgi:transcription initiation factor IIE alpha subunit